MGREVITVDPEAARYGRFTLGEQAERLRKDAATLRRKAATHLPIKPVALHAADALEAAARSLESRAAEINPGQQTA